MIATVDKLKMITPISNAVNPEFLEPFISISEEFHIRPVLGDDFYDYIIDQIDEGTLSGDTKKLVDRCVIPSIAYFAWYEASPTLWMKTENKGLVTKYSDNSNPIDSNAFKIYRQSIYDKAKMYLNSLKKALKEGSYEHYSGNCSNTKSGNSAGFFMNF